MWPCQGLTSEDRVLDGTTDLYNITYVYDQLGNRLEKTDTVAQRHTCYVYDTDWDADADPPAWRSEPAMCYTPDWSPEYATRNNRLLEYREYDTSVTPQRLLRTVHYTYYETGNVSNITLKDEYLGTGTIPDEYTWHYDLALYYTTAGKLRSALWGRWRTAGGQTTYEPQARRQLFYHGYNLVRIRDVDPATLVIDPTYPETETWRDYFGGEVYGDFQVDVTPGTPYVATATDQQAYLAGPGLAQQDADGANTRYHHSDLIDSSMLLTDSGGTAVSAVSYTAFGEPVVWTGSAWQVGGPLPEGYPRYAYAGDNGYESDLLTLEGANATLPPVTLAHVGWRWYQAEIGRFVQRDPLGIHGGLNLYMYCRANPLVRVDPAGLISLQPSGDPDAIAHIEEQIETLILIIHHGAIETIQPAIDRLRLLLQMRNQLYGDLFGPACLILLPVAGGYAGGAAAEALKPWLAGIQGSNGGFTHGVPGAGKLLGGNIE